MGWPRKGGKCDSIESPKHFASYCFSSTQGVLALAVGGIVNSFWDLWGKLEGKPVWKLLCDMTPEQSLTVLDMMCWEDGFQPLNYLYKVSKKQG